MVPVRRRRVLASSIGAVAALTLGLSSCAVGEIGGESGGGARSDDRDHLPDPERGADAVPFGEALIEKFQAANPDIKVTMDNQPGGTEGDNLMKTKLATGEMADVFHYNSGSLFQALNPDQNLVPLTDEPWVGELSEDFKAVVSTPNGTYGAPSGSTQAGGVLYNKKVYERLGLKVPTSWSEFVANNEKIKADGKVDTDPSRPTATPGPRSCSCSATSPTSRRRTRTGPPSTPPTSGSTPTSRRCRASPTRQEMYKAGYFNKNFASARFDGRTEGNRHRHRCALPDADQRHRDGQAEQPGQRR